mmetsp:Transcript_54819/g.174165  ORF Transcript_54819/g.174165 Transcript_54819/m.174165 type:complete len:224 (+) Transcript_54819:544-1215(+)
MTITSKKPFWLRPQYGPGLRRSMRGDTAMLSARSASPWLKNSSSRASVHFLCCFKGSAQCPMSATLRAICRISIFCASSRLLKLTSAPLPMRLLCALLDEVPHPPEPSRGSSNGMRPTSPERLPRRPRLGGAGLIIEVTLDLKLVITSKCFDRSVPRTIWMTVDRMRLLRSFGRCERKSISGSRPISRAVNRLRFSMTFWSLNCRAQIESVATWKVLLVPGCW